jgi:lipopolysaccharide/colanic/teichoic acid biosynthesis glycosyltransferase
MILALTSPIMAAAAIAVALTLGRPIFFVQERTGLSRQKFRMFKLRTMKNLTDRNGVPLPDSARLSALGRFLRRSSIDELPELVNVIRGDMSLVGPRPLLPRYDPWYSPRESVRFRARPGITGLAQVNGRNNAAWDERLEMDARYVSEWSYSLDLKILARTCWQALVGRGVAIDPRAVMLDLDMERQRRP